MNAPIEKLTGRDLYVANKAKLRPEDLVPYHGHWVAWSQEGDRVVAHHPDLGEVVKAIEGMGMSTEEVVFDRIPEDGEPEAIL
jgi:hypothetical protein